VYDEEHVAENDLEPLSTELYWLVGTADGIDGLKGVYTSEEAAKAAKADDSRLDTASIYLDRAYPVFPAFDENLAAEPQQADVSELLDLVQQYGNVRVFALGALHAEEPDVLREHLATANALFARIAALLPQQPVQARDHKGRMLWLHECGAVTPMKVDPTDKGCWNCAAPGPWRPLLVGGTPAPEGDREAYWQRRFHEEAARGDEAGQQILTLHRERNEARDFIAQVMEALGVDRPEDVLITIQKRAEAFRRVCDAADLRKRQRDERLTLDESSRLARRFDEARAEVERLKAELTAEEDGRRQDWVEHLTPASADPLVLSLPEVPMGAVIARTPDPGGGVPWRWTLVTSGPHAGQWVTLNPGRYVWWWQLFEHGEVRVELAPPREPRTFPEPPDCPDDLNAVADRHGVVHRRAEGKPSLWGEDRRFWSELLALGPLTEVFDEPSGEQR
jgi:hypothetical protein